MTDKTTDGISDEVKCSKCQTRLAPVQGFSAGIPWQMHLRAYDAYCKLYGKQQALIQGWCRGGFSTEELDMFIPGWREEVWLVNDLREQLAAAEAEVKRQGENFLREVERGKELQLRAEGAESACRSYREDISNLVALHVEAEAALAAKLAAAEKRIEGLKEAAHVTLKWFDTVPWPDGFEFPAEAGTLLAAIAAGK